MSVYLKQFSTHSEYEQYINGSGAILPNVSICTTEGDVHYNPSIPPTPVETRLVAKFNVTDTSKPTMITNNKSSFSEIEIDGVKQTSVTTGYTFDTVGEHTVKYILTDPSTIGNGAFYDCISLTSVDIPNSVTSIGNMAFNSCSGITSIDIPNSVTTIGPNVFNSCSGLTSIVIPSGVTSIGDSAFYMCINLTSVTVNATTPPSLGHIVFNGNTSGRKIYTPSGSVEAYKAATNWSEYANDIEPIS